MDGRDVWPVLADNGPSPHEFVCWKRYDQAAIREGEWKLVINGIMGLGEEHALEGSDKVFLSNLSEDSREVRNLASRHPEVVRAPKPQTATLGTRRSIWRLTTALARLQGVRRESSPRQVSGVRRQCFNRLDDDSTSFELDAARSLKPVERTRRRLARRAHEPGKIAL